MPINVDGDTIGKVTADSDNIAQVTADGDIVFEFTIEAPSGLIAFNGDSNIPSGWVICDGNNGTPDLIGKYIHMVGATEDPGTTGGSSSPSSNGHDHGAPSMPTRDMQQDIQNELSLNLFYGNMETASPSIGNEHPHHEIIPIQATGTDATFDQNVVMGVDGAIPADWSSSSFNSGILKGATSNDSSNLGSSSGSSDHAHSFPNYVEMDTVDQGTGDGSPSAGANSVGESINNQPEYVTLEMVSADITEADPSDLIGFWNGLLSGIPSGWLLCDGNNGTPNLARDRMLRADSSTGNTGGSNTASTSEHAHQNLEYADDYLSGSTTGAAYTGFLTFGDNNGSEDVASWSDIRKTYHKLAPIQRQP